MTMYALIPLALLAAIMIPLVYAVVNSRRGGKPSRSKKAVYANLAAFAVVCLVSIVFPFGGFASAATDAAATSVGAGLGLIAAALSTGLACLGAGIAVAKGSAAAIGAISENRGTFGLAMVFVVLGEGIAIYGIAISFAILGHVH